MALALPLDTLAISDELKKAGFTDEQAEAQTRLHARVFQTLVEEKLATKEDLAHVEQRLQKEIGTVRQEITAVRQELKEDIIQLKGRIENLSLKLTIRLGGLLIAGVVALGVIIKL